MLLLRLADRFKYTNVYLTLSLFIVPLLSQAQVISCIENINVSLDGNCSSVIEPQDVLSNFDPNETYDVSLTDEHNIAIDGDSLTIEYLWTTVTARITNTGNNSCWATLNVEDKLGPIIQCIDTLIIDCNDSLDFFPAIEDNCQSSSIVVNRESITRLDCDPLYTARVDRTYIAEDATGNTTGCQQTILLRRIDLNQIVFPDTLSVESGNALSCRNTTFNIDGFPDISSSGVPTIDGDPIFPNTSTFCNVAVDFEDALIVDQSCVRKYVRTWTVYELWCSGGPVVRFTQLIQVVDNEDPVIGDLLNISVAASTSPNCEALVTLPIPSVTDDCVGGITLNINYDGGFLPNVKTPPAVIFPIGITTVTYRAVDACGNSSTTTLSVMVSDDTAPVSICNRETVVSLRSDGTARAWSETFDEGSFDNCGTIAKSVVRRMNSSCGCDTVSFRDMTFLGQLNGRYYYISDKEVYGFQAIAFSDAYGGMPLTLESTTEATWVHNQIASVTTDPYYFGLVNDNGAYNYPGHVVPSFTNWSMGEPDVSNSNAVILSDGTWQSVDGNTQLFRYVYEATSPCGFGDEVNFCCEDSGTTVMLQFRAIDNFGGYTQCNIEVEVQDKFAPVILCPDNRVLDCSTSVDMNNLNVFGMATATDVCSSVIQSTADSSNMNSCGVGQIIRTFTASDATSASTCTQTISLVSNAASTSSGIVFPEDFDSDTNTGCDSNDFLPSMLPAGFDRPILTGASCTNLASTYRDQTFSFSGQGGDACFKIVRTWTIVDECMKGMPGYTPVTFEQSIKVSDDVAPTPTTASCADVEIFITDCTDTMVTLTGSSTDNCTPDADINSRITLDIFGDASIDADESYNNNISFSRMLPLGFHIATLQFFDGCGNVGTCTRRISVINNQVPLVKCTPGLIIPLQELDLNNDNTVDTIAAIVNADILDGAIPSLNVAGSTHPCNSIIGFSFSPSITDQSRTFTCDDIGDNDMILYVTDTFGNSASCNTTITITDNNNLCSGMTSNRQANIDGNVMTENAAAVSDVQVQLLGSEFPDEVTEEDGQYAFPTMNVGGDYMVVPTRNDNPLNGVSTLDIIQIQRHVLGLELLDSPYKIIAADIDNSGAITALDLIGLRKLILGAHNEFVHVDSWRLIDAEQKFLDPLNPFAYALREDHVVQELDVNMSINFIAVKMGDVNNTAVASLHSTLVESRSKKNVIVELVVNKVDDKYIVDLNVDGLEFYDGLQLSLKYDPSNVKLVDVASELPTFLNSNYVIDENSNTINISWNSQNHEVPTDVLCQIELKANSSLASDFVVIDEERMQAEAYSDGQIMDIELRNSQTLAEVNEHVLLYQNIPNPWSTSTVIKYELYKDQDIELNFYNPSGQLLYQEIKSANKGENVSEIDNSIFASGGILYYEIITDSTRIIKKMLLVK